MISRKITMLMILSVFFLSVASANFIGTAPGQVTLGEIEQGESVEGEFYITSDLDNNFTVEPSIGPEFSSTVFSENNPNRNEVSEDSFYDWFEFESGEVDPTTSFTVEREDQPGINAVGAVGFTMDVPSDAQPGVRYGRISVDPDLDSGNVDGAAGTQNLGVSDIRVLFRVPGNVDRHVEAVDVRAFRSGEDSVRLEKNLVNRGSVTVNVADLDFEILDSEGNVIEEGSRNAPHIEPGESQWVELNWRDDERIEGGSYHFDGEADYMTGQAFVSESFNLPDFDVIEVEEDEESPVGEEGEDTLPIWLVIMILAVLGVLMWSFEIDPVWIFGIIGFLGIGALIFLTPVSNWLILAPLLIVAALYYI